MKTTAQAYSVMQVITNHSFAGAAEGTESQSIFVKRNIEYFRNLLAEEINSGEPEDILNAAYTNFAGRGSSGIAINPYIVADGNLPKITCKWNNNAGRFDASIAFRDPPPDDPSPKSSYANIVADNGLQRGDQLTFLQWGVDDTQEVGQFNSFHYARVILEPASGDMSVPFLDTQGTEVDVNDPNQKNEGDVKFFPEDGVLAFRLPALSNTKGRTNSICGAAVIVSRLIGDTWGRSEAVIALRPWTVGISTALSLNHDVDTLGDAVYSYMTLPSSSLYLNQSE